MIATVLCLTATLFALSRGWYVLAFIGSLVLYDCWSRWRYPEDYAPKLETRRRVHRNWWDE